MPTPTDVVEALLFASDTPLEAERISEVLDLGDVSEARRLIDELRARYEASSQGLQIVEVGGGYRMVTRPEVAPWLVRLARARTRTRLSRPALEALAIVAYKQPVSRPEIDAVRGVNSEGVLDNLLERTLRRLIEEQSRQRPRQIEPNPPSVLERMTMILSVLRDTWSLLFSSLTAGDRRRSEIVVSLLAVLELVRLGRIKTQQTELFGEIVIERQTAIPNGEPTRADSN